MEEQKDSEQTYWRIEPFGWDSEDRTYIVLDDNRVYRTTEPPSPPPPKPKPKKNSKKARASTRASKRRRVSQAAESEHEEPEAEEEEKKVQPVEDDGLGGVKWECLAITLDEANALIASFAKTRDDNEKILRKRLVDDLLPLLEAHEEKRKRKIVQRERELKNMEMLAHAKRSSRIASKMQHQHEEEARREAERKHQYELVVAKKEEAKWKKLEKERESRMMTREQRIKEREARRILHEEELAHLSEDNKKLETGEAGRLSERHLKAEIERKKQALEELQDDDDWVFDCICGAYGHVDDGTLSIACERCNVWQHTKCVGVSDEDAGREDFHFICSTCKRREMDAEEEKNKPKITFKLNHNQVSPKSEQEQNQQRLLANDGSPKMMQYGDLSPAKQRQVHSSPTRPPHDTQGNGNRALPPIPFANGQAQAAYTNGNLPRPVSQGTPYEPQYAAQRNGTTPARLSFGSHMNGSSPFSAPVPHSPTSLPPPVPDSNYHTLNGNRPPSHGSYVGSTPAQQNGIDGPNGQRSFSNQPCSGAFSSPLAQSHGPLINQSQYQPQPQTYNGNPNSIGAQTNNGNTLRPLINQTPAKPPSNPASAFTTPAQPPSQPYHVAAETPYSNNATYTNGNDILPPMSAGISPVKNSSPPPRPPSANRNVSFNGSFNASFNDTPNSLPPAPPLPPSPQVIDPTPPVKQNRPVSSGLSFGVGNVRVGEQANGSGEAQPRNE